MGDKIKKPVVDKEKCIGCGTCESLCPEVFKINDAGKSEVLADADFSQHQETIQTAIDSCPVDAISWKE